MRIKIKIKVKIRVKIKVKIRVKIKVKIKMKIKVKIKIIIKIKVKVKIIEYTTLTACQKATTKRNRTYEEKKKTEGRKEIKKKEKEFST